MEVFDISHVLRPQSQTRKQPQKLEHKYQFLNYENVLNKTFTHHLKGQYSGVGFQHSISKILDEQYCGYPNSQDMTQYNNSITNDSSLALKERERTQSPDSSNGALNEQLLRITQSRIKQNMDSNNEKEYQTKSFREKMFFVDLNSILRENPKTNSSRQTSQRSKMLNLGNKRKSDSDSLTLINVEQLQMKEKLKRTFQKQQQYLQSELTDNESQFRNTIGLSPFKTTFRVRRQQQQKARSPELTTRRTNNHEEQQYEVANSQSTYQCENSIVSARYNGLTSAISIDDQQETIVEQHPIRNENQIKLIENSYLIKKLNEQKKQIRVDIKLPQFNGDGSAQQGEVQTNKIFNKVLLKASLNKTQDQELHVKQTNMLFIQKCDLSYYKYRNSKSLDQKSSSILKYSQCQPILWVDNSQQKAKKQKKQSKIINFQMGGISQNQNNQSFGSPIRRSNSKAQVKLNNSLVIQQTPIFFTQDIKFNYSICYGNNSNLIRRVMQRRQPQWNEISTTLTNYQFRWQPTSHGYNFHSIADSNAKYPRVFNHFEFHKHLSDKSLLLFNVVIYCVKNDIDAFEFMPISFYFDFTSKQFEKDLYKFTHIFERLNCQIKNNEQLRSIPSDQDIQMITQNNFKETIKIFKQVQQSKSQNKLEHQPKTTIEILEKQIQRQFLQMQETNFLRANLNENLLFKQNLWVLKPVNLNRGNGITVVQSLGEVNSNISSGFELPQSQQQHSGFIFQASSFNFSPNTPNNKKKQQQQQTTPKSNSKPLFYQFILQKYIEKPLLFQNRKFDIRIWVLVTYTNKFQFYQSKEGWVRTSGYKFDLNSTNKYIHLTNNAVQKNSDQYGQFENGNSINYSTLKKYINHLSQERGASPQQWDRIQSTIKKIIKITLSSTIDKINVFNREKQFELFGYDFMIDQSFKPWLIEVNTNPCIEESSDVLKQILPRLIDDMLRLSVDQFFNKQQNENKSYFPLKGYTDEENIFEEFIL